ncbi:MAG: hypothetical protein K0S45_1503 [Nitrospira sp.]|jgi:hypothetical protein|nr:hypothetical protein [Nitrospira sp.]
MRTWCIALHCLNLLTCLAPALSIGKIESLTIKINPNLHLQVGQADAFLMINSYFVVTVFLKECIDEWRDRRSLGEDYQAP